jgi:hypothetical protein
VLSEAQIQLLERHSVDFRCRHVEANRPGELLNQDTFYCGTRKGGKIPISLQVGTCLSRRSAVECYPGSVKHIH